MSYTVYKQKYPELLCPHCRKRTSYQIHDHMKEEDIKGIQFQWKETYGICDECGKEIFLPEIYDQNMIKNFGNIIMKKRSVKIKRRISYERAFIFKSK